MNTKKDLKPYDVTSAIIDFETGAMESDEKVIELFQYLIDTGMAWQLQGSYGRMAFHLIKEGYCNGHIPN